MVVVMQSFEDLRAAVGGNKGITSSDPYLISIDVPLDNGRSQGVFLADLEHEDGSRLLRISSPVAPLDALDALRCLRFNWAQRVGFLAAGELDGRDYLHVCENRRYRALDADEIDGLLTEVADLADRLESLLTEGRDHA